MALYDTTEERLLRAALTMFTDLGALAAARITRQKMQRLGIRSIPVGPRTATRADPLGLTRRGLHEPGRASGPDRALDGAAVFRHDVPGTFLQRWAGLTKWPDQSRLTKW